MAQVLSETELLALVDRLADGAWHSGEQLAAASGITRAALAKRIDRLADWQLTVEARQGLGYRLSTPIERLDEAALQHALGERLRVRVVPVTDSTSSRLLETPAQNDPQALLAEFQTAGRGRRGRSWLSPFGTQLALSLAWSYDALPPQLTALPLAVGVICARVLQAQGAAVALKWPNDLVVRGENGELRKLGGILLEHRGEGGGGCRVVVGIGINLSVPPGQAATVAQPWINLGELIPVARNRLAADLLQALERMLAEYPQTGFAPLAADWARFDVAAGHAVRVLIGERPLDGIACGIDAHGALIVEAHGVRHHLHSGEISLRLLT